MNIGIYGGAFSPITRGHIEAAKYALCILDKIVFVPCYNHPWGKKSIDFEHILKMCRIAMEKNMSVEDFEKDLPGDTLSLVQKLKHDLYYGQQKLFFIIGVDEANKIKEWKNYKQLLQAIKFIVIPRPGKIISQQTLKLFDTILPPTITIPKISSTEIRKDLKKYYSNGIITPQLKFNLNPKVFEYITKNNLYR
jgi:nicotinate-nucleotide adenylyltransferase